MSAVAAAFETKTEDALDRILQLAAAERAARNSPLWKMAMEKAIDAHAEVVDRLYEELYRQLDERAGNPPPKWKPPADPRVELKKRITAAVKAELPEMIAQIVDQF